KLLGPPGNAARIAMDKNNPLCRHVGFLPEWHRTPQVSCDKRAIVVIVLEVLEGAERGHVVKFEGGPIAIGRAPQSELPLSDYHLSGQHGQIFLENDHYVYRDLRSTNGSRVERADSVIEIEGELVLRDGDRLVLGDPSSPVVVFCRIEAPANEDAGRVIAV